MQKTFGLPRYGLSRCATTLVAAMTVMTLGASSLSSQLLFAADPAPAAAAAAAAPAKTTDSATNVVIDAPVNAAVLIIVPNPQQFSQHLAITSESIGVSLPLLADSLGQIKAAFGVNKGMAEDAPIMVAFPVSKGGLLGSASEGQTLAYFPITNYVDFLSNFNGNPNELTTQVKLPRDFTGFCRRLGNHAVVGSQKGTLDAMNSPGAGKPILESLGPKGVQLIANSDFSIVLNLEMARGQLLADLDAKISEANTSREKLAKDKRPAESNNLVTHIAALQALRAVVNEASGIVISGNLNPQGLTLQTSIQLSSTSPTAALLKAPKDSAPLLSLVSSDIYMAAQSVSLESFKTDALVDLAVKQMEPMVEDPLTAILVRFLPVLNKASGFGQTYNHIVTSSGFGNSDISVQVFQTKDPAGLRQSLADAILSLEKKPFPGLASQNIPFTTAYTKDQILIGDLHADQYEIRVSASRSVLDAGKDSQVLQTLASTGISGFVCAGPDFVVVSTIPDAGLIRATIESIKKKSGTGDSRGIRFTRSNLPPAPSLEMFWTSSAFIRCINLIRTEDKLRPLATLPVTSQMGVNVVTSPANITVTAFLGTDLARVIYLAATQKEPSFTAPGSADQPSGSPDQQPPQPAAPNGGPAAGGFGPPPPMPGGGPGLPPPPR